MAVRTCGPRWIGDRQDQQQYQRLVRYRAIFREIVREKCADPRECETGVGPLFEYGHAGNDEGDAAQGFGDSQNNAELLRISHMRECLNHLWTARQVGVSAKEGHRGQKNGGHPISYFARHGAESPFERNPNTSGWWVEHPQRRPPIRKDFQGGLPFRIWFLKRWGRFSLALLLGLRDGLRGLTGRFLLLGHTLRFIGVLADFHAERHPFSNFDFRISVLYPKMSFTLSKIEELRSAGLLSTLIV